MFNVIYNSGSFYNLKVSQFPFWGQILLFHRIFVKKQTKIDMVVPSYFVIHNFECKKINNVLMRDSANFFCEGLGSKYFRLAGHI